MTITYQQVIDAARPTLNDDAKKRYPDAECLGYLNEALLELVVHRPDLFVASGDIPCVAGVEQACPVGTDFLIEIFSIKNGAGISRTTIDVLRAFRPSWRIDTSGPAVNWGFFPQDEKYQRGATFFVYPPSLLGQVLTGQFIRPPAVQPIGAIGVNVPAPDKYLVPLKAYIIFCCESKDDEYTVDGRAAAFAGRYVQLLAEADKNEGA